MAKKHDFCEALDAGIDAIEYLNAGMQTERSEKLRTLKERIERGVEHRGFGARQRRPTLIIDWSDEGEAG